MGCPRDTFPWQSSSLRPELPLFCQGSRPPSLPSAALASQWTPLLALFPWPIQAPGPALVSVSKGPGTLQIWGSRLGKGLHCWMPGLGPGLGPSELGGRGWEKGGFPEMPETWEDPEVHHLAKLLEAPQVAPATFLPPPQPFPACPHMHSPTCPPYTPPRFHVSSRPQLPLCPDMCVLGLAFSLECSMYIASFIA